MGQIILEKIQKTFGNVEVIPPLDLVIEDGEFVVFVGPSGCGKSTLLRLIAGLEDTTSGSIEIDGVNATNLPPAKRRLAMVFQSYALYPHMSVRKNIAFPLRMAKLDKDEQNKRVEDAAKVLNLTEYLDRRPAQLSGGQRQRVAIGRAIVREPSAFLFDEPLSNLDAALRVGMRMEISSLHKKLQTTMVYVTHDQVEAMTMADKIVVLKDGVIEQVGTPIELYREPKNLFVAGFIGSPKMNIIKINKQHISNLNTLDLFNNKITFDNLEFKDEIYIGIRPEDISLKKDHEIKVDVKIDLVENLGFEKIIYSKVLDKQIIIKSSENINSNSLKISFSKDKILFFDKDKNRIR